jgi:Tfp pilus assembly protein PilF
MMDEVKEARRLFELGYQYQMQRQLSRAIECYRQSIALHPTAEAHTFLGWAFSMLGHIELAIEECHRAIEVDPSFGNPYNDIGAYLIEKGQWEEAIPWLEKAIQAPRYEARAYPHFNLGRVYEHLGRWDEAIACYKRALLEEPNYGLAKNTLLHLQAKKN